MREQCFQCGYHGNKTHVYVLVEYHINNLLPSYVKFLTHVYTNGSALIAVEQAGLWSNTQKQRAKALQTISKDCDNPGPPCVNRLYHCHIHRLAVSNPSQMQHHKQPISTDILNNSQWSPGRCDIPGNDRADKLARQGTSKTQQGEQVSYTLHPSR